MCYQLHVVKCQKMSSPSFLLLAVSILVITEHQLLAVIDLSSCPGPAVGGITEYFVKHFQILIFDDGWASKLIWLTTFGGSRGVLCWMAGRRCWSPESSIRIRCEGGTHSSRSSRVWIVGECSESRSTIHLECVTSEVSNRPSFAIQ